MPYVIDYVLYDRLPRHLLAYKMIRYLCMQQLTNVNLDEVNMRGLRLICGC